MRGKCEKCGRGPMTIWRGMCGNCYKQWRRWNLSPDRVCPVCSKEFHHTTNLEREFCSKECNCRFKKGKDSTLSHAASYEIRRCLLCNGEFKAEGSNIRAGGGKYCSPKCWGIARRSRSWQERERDDSRTHWRVAHGWIEFASKLIVSRGIRCELCACDTGSLCVHHRVDPNPGQNVGLLLDPGNCVVLCRGCHRKVHAGTMEKNPKKRQYSPPKTVPRNDKRKTCEVCGKEFAARLAKQKACSRGCGVILRNRQVYGPK